MATDNDVPADTRFHFTDARLKALDLPAGGHVDYSDETQPGLLCRVTATGKRSLHIYKWSRVLGRPIRRRIGSLGTFSVNEARKVARDLVVRIEKGENPNEEERAARIAYRTDTWADLWEKYQGEKHPECRKSTVYNDKCMWERHICGRPKKTQRRDEVPAPLPVGLSDTRSRAYTPDEAREWHKKLTQEVGATTADEVVVLMSRLYRHGGIEPNPFQRNARGNGEQGLKLNGKRKVVKYLTAEGYQKLVRALDVDSDQEVADLVRMALFTGQRRDNVRTARWDEIDLHVRVWRIPAAKFKTKKDADTPLPMSAVEVLKRRLKEREKRGDQSPFVFPSRLNPSRPRQVMRRQVSRIFRRAGLEGWRFHDLRHACASAILLAGGTLAQAGRQLNHANAASTERYGHLDAATVAKAADRAFAALSSIKQKPMRRRSKPDDRVGTA